MSLPPMKRPLSIFMAGGTGFVGQALAVRLAREGHSLTLATRDARRADDLLPLASVEIAAGDVYSVDFLRAALEGCDLAINLVGILNERGHGGAGFRQAHVEFTQRLLAGMREAGVTRLLHMSALNADARQGSSYYLRTKGEAEERVRACEWLDWTLFRPSVIFGPGDSLTRRFARLLRWSHGLLPLACPDARFAPIYVDDVADAFLCALPPGRTSRQCYELCGPEILSLEQIVRRVAHAAALPCRIWRLPDALARVQAALMDFIPGKPFSTDNYRSLRVDSVCRDDGIRRLGLVPASFAARLPLWLSPVLHSSSRARGSRAPRRTAE